MLNASLDFYDITVCKNYQVASENMKAKFLCKYINGMEFIERFSDYMKCHKFLFNTDGWS